MSWGDEAGSRDGLDRWDRRARGRGRPSARTRPPPPRPVRERTPARRDRPPDHESRPGVRSPARGRRRSRDRPALPPAVPLPRRSAPAPRTSDSRRSVCPDQSPGRAGSRRQTHWWTPPRQVRRSISIEASADQGARSLQFQLISTYSRSPDRCRAVRGSLRAEPHPSARAARGQFAAPSPGTPGDKRRSAAEWPPAMTRVPRNRVDSLRGCSPLATARHPCLVLACRSPRPAIKIVVET